MTDRRTIMAFDKPKMGAREGFSELFGKNAGLDKVEEIDYATIDIDRLAAMNDNTSVPHTSIEKLRLGKAIGGYTLVIEYRSEDGKKQLEYADISPPRALIRMRKAEGVSAAETKRQYVIKSQELFKKALPPVIAEKAEWPL